MTCPTKLFFLYLNFISSFLNLNSKFRSVGKRFQCYKRKTNKIYYVN